jgi:hypothetical protein
MGPLCATHVFVSAKASGLQPVMFCTGVEGSYAIRAARVHEVCSLVLISNCKRTHIQERLCKLCAPRSRCAMGLRGCVLQRP